MLNVVAAASPLEFVVLTDGESLVGKVVVCRGVIVSRVRWNDVVGLDLLWRRSYLTTSTLLKMVQATCARDRESNPGRCDGMDERRLPVIWKRTSSWVKDVRLPLQLLRHRCRWGNLYCATKQHEQHEILIRNLQSVTRSTNHWLPFIATYHNEEFSWQNSWTSSNSIACFETATGTLRPKRSFRQEPWKSAQAWICKSPLFCGRMTYTRHLGLVAMTSRVTCIDD